MSASLDWLLNCFDGVPYSIDWVLVGCTFHAVMTESRLGRLALHSEYITVVV